MGRDKELIHKAPYISVSVLSKLGKQRSHSCRKSMSVGVTLKLVQALSFEVKALNPLKMPSSSVTSEPLSPTYLERAGKFSV